MRAFFVSFVFLSSLFLAGCSESSKAGSSAGTAAASAAATLCAHGVQSNICARCNPKLEPVFRAQNDWCEEHARPESQCALCNPEVARKGVK